MSVADVLAASAASSAVALVAARWRPQAHRPLTRRDHRSATVAPARRRRLLLAVTVALVAGVAVVGIVTTLVVTAGIGGVVIRRRHLGARRRQRSVETAMPDAVELMVVCLHAGLTPTQAIIELARLAPIAVRPAFAAVERRLHRGAGVTDALGQLSAECGASAAGLVIALGAAVRDGLPLAPVLDRLTDEAVASRRRNGEAAARRLPVRLSFPLVACTLPSFLLLAIAPAVLGALSTVRGSAP